MLFRCFFLRAMNPHTRNVLQMGAGFFFIFLAFNSQGFIEESVLDTFAQTGQVDKHAGYTSLSIIYASFTVLNFVAPPIIQLLGTRTALALSGLAYVLFLAGFLALHQWFLYGSSALLGLGAAIIWTAQGKYLTRNSTEKTAGKHSSLFLALTQACMSCGGIFLLIIFLSTSSNSDQNTSNSPNSTLSSASFAPSTIFLIYSSFTAIALFGVLILAFLPKSRHSGAEKAKAANEGAKAKRKSSNLEQIKSIFKVAATPKMAALALSFAYSGILLSFWSSIFPTAILNTLQFQAQFSPKVLIALNSIVKGLGQPLLSLFFHWFHLHRIRRSRLVLFGALINLAAFALCFLNLPNISPLSRTDEAALIRPSAWIALLCGFLLSFGDACWNTQLFSFLIANYPSKSAEAFALLKFYQSLLTSILFYLSAHLLLHWQLLILLVSAILGYLGFMIAEMIEERRPREIRVQNE